VRNLKKASERLDTYKLEIMYINIIEFNIYFIQIFNMIFFTYDMIYISYKLGHHFGRCYLQERAVASRVLHVHPLQHHASWSEVHQSR